MNTTDILRPLVGGVENTSAALVCPPADGWRQAVGHLFRREVNRLRSRRLSPTQRELVIWGAPPGRRPRFPGLRQTLLGGTLYVEVPDGSPIRSAHETNHFVPSDHARVGSGGGLRQFGTLGDQAVLLRLGAIDTSGDPGRHYQALVAIDHAAVPHAFAIGTTGDVRWTFEGHIEGHRIDTPTPEMVSQLDAFLAGLPKSSERIDTIGSSAAVLPTEAVGFNLDRITTAIETNLGGLPAITAHGDLWAGNLLFRGGQLVGVLDWDSWQERAVPGTDLIHLHAEETRRRRGVSYGDLVAERFWLRPDIARAVEIHLGRLGITWDERLLETLGQAWWIVAVAGALRRSPGLANDSRWMMRNVKAPGRLISDQLR